MLRFFVIGSTTEINQKGIYLIHDSWDDWFEYSTSYNMWIKDDDIVRIGRVKIAQKNQKVRTITLDNEFSKLEDDCFSVGFTEDYYEELKHTKYREHALGETGKGYKEELSGDLCWMRLHIDSFQYSEELEELYSCYDKTDEFSKGFINSEFRRAITQIVIALHHNKKAVAKKAYKQATAIYSPSCDGKIHNILARHNYKETLKITAEAKKFLSGLNL